MTNMPVQLNDTNVGHTAHFCDPMDTTMVLSFLDHIESQFNAKPSILHGMYSDKFAEYRATGKKRIGGFLTKSAKRPASDFFIFRFSLENHEILKGFRISTHSLVDGNSYSLIDVSFSMDQDHLGHIEKIGHTVAKLTGKVSGFSLGDVPYDFFSSYAKGSVGFIDSFPNCDERSYKAFDNELFWYGRLARQIDLENRYGLFRNIYPYNFLCEEKIFTLKNIFECSQFPILSKETEDRHKKRSKLFGDRKKPILPGTLTDLGNHSALWCVPNEERKATFAILEAANMMIYRFFIDHNDLFPTDHHVED
ncbi:MAG: hypothetical protein ABJJ20_01630 [Lentilitoribacter sp.]